MKNGKFLTMIILLAFSLPFAYGGCSGGGGGGLVDEGDKPHISNLLYTPTSADLGSGDGSITVFGSIDFEDDRDVLEVTINLFDSAGNLIDSNTDPIIDAFRKKSGTIEVTFNINTSVEDDYTFDIFVTDQFKHTSNDLTGTFIVTHPSWKTRASMPALREMWK